MGALLQKLIQLLSYALSILSIVESIKGLVESIKTALSPVAQEPSPGYIVSVVQGIDGDLEDVETGLVPIHDTQVVQGLTIDQIKAVVDIIHGVVDTLTPTPLPDPAPPSYHPPSPSENWGETYTQPYAGGAWPGLAVNHIVRESLFHLSMASARNGWRMAGNPDFTWHNPTAIMVDDNGSYDTYIYPPIRPLFIDWSLWEPGEDIVGLCNRLSDNLTWESVYESGYMTARCRAYVPTYLGGVTYWECHVEDWELPIRSGKWLTMLQDARVGPPVWPGADHVTLGTPVALSSGLTIEESMDGVIVEITGTPSGMGKYEYDDTESWVHAGSLVFFDDAGNFEMAQGFSFTKHIACPKMLTRASGVKVRAASGVTGWVTPWLIDSYT